MKRLTIAAIIIAAALSQVTYAEQVATGPATEIPVDLVVEPAPIEEQELELVTDYGSYEHDLDIMAHLLCGECQGGSRELQEAVGSVVLNRVASSKFPDTIEEVVFQRGQYACTWDGNYNRTPTDRNWEVAGYLLQNGSQIPEGVVFQAQHVQGRIWQKIANEYFCYGK